MELFEPLMPIEREREMNEAVDKRRHNTAPMRAAFAWSADGESEDEIRHYMRLCMLAIEIDMSNRPFGQRQVCSMLFDCTWGFEHRAELMRRVEKVVQDTDMNQCSDRDFRMLKLYKRIDRLLQGTFVGRFSDDVPVAQEFFFTSLLFFPSMRATIAVKNPLLPACFERWPDHTPVEPRCMISLNESLRALDRTRHKGTIEEYVANIKGELLKNV